MTGVYPPPGIPNRDLPPYLLHGPGFDPVFNGSHTFGTTSNPLLNQMFARNNYRHHDILRFADMTHAYNHAPDMGYYNNAVMPGVSRASDIFKNALGLNSHGDGHGAGHGGVHGEGGSDRSLGKTASRTAIGAGLGFAVGSVIGSPFVGGPIGAAIGGAAGFISSLF